MIDLKSQYGHAYRISREETAKVAGQTREDRMWLYRIPCKYGHIFVHGVDRLGAYCGRVGVIKRLVALDGVTIHQRGDREVSVTFPPSMLDSVADVLRAKRRPVRSPAQQEVSLRSLAKIQPKGRGLEGLGRDLTSGVVGSDVSA